MAAVTWRRPGELLCGSAIWLAACLTAVHALRLAAGVDAQGVPFALAGVVLGALGLVMILSGSIDAIKSIIALGALPFVFIVLVLVVCLLKALKTERPIES